MTNLTLRDFNEIASGKYNAGIVDFQKKSNGNLQLIKLNNFVHRTSKNNKTLTTERILDIKEKFMTALEHGGVNQKNLDEIRKELGIPRSLSVNGSADENQVNFKNRFLPLTRNAIRVILDKYANGGIGCGDYATAVKLTAKELKAASNTANMSKSREKIRENINNSTVKMHYQAKENSVLNALSLLSPKRSIKETAESTANAHISINREDNNATYIKNNAAKIKNQYLSMCRIAMKMTTSNIQESEIFKLCDEAVKLVKDGSGKLSAIIGKGSDSIKINMDIEPQKMMSDLFLEAVKGRDVIGKGEVRMLLNDVFENDLNGSITGHDRNSLSRNFAAMICSEISHDDFSDVINGDYNTLFLLDVAQFSLDGKTVTKKDMMEYLNKIVKNNSGLSDEMKDMLRQSANIPFQAAQFGDFYVDQNMITESLSKVAEENVPKPQELQKNDPGNSAEKKSLMQLQFSDKAVINDLLNNSQKLRSFVLSKQNIGLFGKLLANDTSLLTGLNNGDNLEKKYPEQYKKLLADVETASQKFEAIFLDKTGKKLSTLVNSPDFSSEFTTVIGSLSDEQLALINNIIKDISIINDYQIKDFVADLIFSDDTMVAEALQSNPGDAMRHMLVAPEHINIFASIMKNPEVLNVISDQATTAIVKQNFDEIRAIVDAAFQKSEGKSLAEAAKAPDFEEKFQAFVSNPQKLPSSELYKFGFLIQKMANKGCEHIQQFINQVFKVDNKAVNEQGGITIEPYKDMNATEIKKDLDKKTIKDIMHNAASDATAPGQLALFKQVLGDYFVNMTLADKKSSFASALRFSQTFDFHDSKGQSLQGELFDSARNRATVKFTGAILKGTSPLMQKMLQGLPRSVVGEYADALDDMKSKLAPIPRKIVQSYLTKMISDSKTTDHPIESIILEKSLGAASVGEAFICQFNYKNPDSKELKHDRLIVKIMRHDAEERVKKEAEIFTAAAEKIGESMVKTWKGQLEQYMKEFDFTHEAENIKEGVKLYDVKNSPDNKSKAIAADVTCMRLSDDLVKPQKNILVGTLGSGETIDSFIKHKVKELSFELNDIFKTDPSSGKIIIEKDSENKPVLIPKELIPISSLFAGTNTLSTVINSIKEREEKLLQAAQLWFSEGFLGSGKFHGDFHSGNIMATSNEATFIDFGNLYEFKKINETDKDGNVITETVKVKDDNGNVIGTEERPKILLDERIEMLRLILGCALRNGTAFRNGFEHLLSPDGRKIFQANKEKVVAIVSSIMEKGDITHDVATRLQCILSELQKLGLEVPPQIYCFVQSMNRLQNTIDEMNNIILLGKHIVDTLNFGNLTGSKEHPVRDDLDLFGKFSDFFRSAEGRTMVPVSESAIDIENNSDFSEGDEPELVASFKKNGVPKYLDEMFIKYLNADDYKVGGKYYNQVLNRITSAEDKLEATKAIFLKVLVEPEDPLHNNPNNETVKNRMTILSNFIESYNKTSNEDERKLVVEKMARTISTAVHSTFNSYKHQIYSSLKTNVTPPATFASVVMKTLFDSFDALDNMLKSFDGSEKAGLFVSMQSVGKADLGMKGFIINPDRVSDELKDKAGKAADLSFDMEIGF